MGDSGSRLEQFTRAGTRHLRLGHHPRRTRVRSCWEVIITSITAQAGLIKLAHALESEAVATDHPARTWVRDRNRGVREQFETSIRLSIERDEIREDIDVAALASILLGIVDGLESQWLIDSDSVDILRANLHAIHLLRTALT